MIDILDRILERVPTILCTFMETFIGVFIYCFPVKKKTGNLIYLIEIWLLLQFIWLEIFCNEESSIPCTIQPSGVVLGVCLAYKSRNPWPFRPWKNKQCSILKSKVVSRKPLEVVTNWVLPKSWRSRNWETSEHIHYMFRIQSETSSLISCGKASSLSTIKKRSPWPKNSSWIAQIATCIIKHN